MDRAAEWLANTDAEWSNDRWNIPNGGTLSFGYLDGPRDHHNFQSANFLYVGIDEVVNIRKHQALYMFSRLRKLKSFQYVNELTRMFERKLRQDEVEYYRRLYESIPLRFRCASNPPTKDQVERGFWVKERYVDAETRSEGAVFIPAWMHDNPFLDHESYKASLKNLDPITRRQLEDGDWNIQVKGNMFDRAWFEIVDAAPAEGRRVRRWDLAATEAKKGKEPAYTVGLRMCEHKGVYYIENVVRFRNRPLYVEQMVRQVADLDGKYVPIRVEQEPGSGGVNTIDNYRRKVLPEFDFKGDKKTSSKIEDASPFSSQCEAGNVKLVKGAWNKVFLDEAELFPHSAFKDQIDAASGAFAFLAKPRVVRITSI
jgi:predicted phage terminase large subunit-like protein